MISRKIILHGEPQGFVTMTRRGIVSARAIKYISWKKRVQMELFQSGLKLPLLSTFEHPVRVDTRAVFTRRNHPDPENVRKGIVDALFYSDTRYRKFFQMANGFPFPNDKYVYGFHGRVEYDEANPRVEIRLYFYDGRN